MLLVKEACEYCDFFYLLCTRKWCCYIRHLAWLKIQRNKKRKADIEREQKLGWGEVATLLFYSLTLDKHLHSGAYQARVERRSFLGKARTGFRRWMWIERDRKRENIQGENASKGNKKTSSLIWVVMEHLACWLLCHKINGL